MLFTLVLSSEIYPIALRDVRGLADAPITYQNQGNAPIVILLGDPRTQLSDTLLCGREKLEAAVAEGRTYVEVAIAFPVKVGAIAFLALFKYWRRRYNFCTANKYHISPSFLRERGLERCIRTAENAYYVRRWMKPEAERNSKYQALSESLKQNGFDEGHPLRIFLHRRKRYLDTLHDGHHRLGLCIQHHIPEIAIRFCYASSFVACKNILLHRHFYTLPCS